MSIPDDATIPAPTAETLRTAALAAFAERRQSQQARSLAEAHAELPGRAAENLGVLIVTPEMLDGEELVADGLRFRLAPSGALLVLLPCAAGVGLCEHEFADLAGLGAVLVTSDQ